MSKSTPDWAAIEADYLATGLAYPALAKKWDVSLSTLKKRAMRGSWGDKMAAVAKRAEAAEELELEPEGEPEPVSDDILPDPLALEMRRRRVRRMLEVSDTVMDHIIDALDVVDKHDTLAIATLTRALKDIRDMQGLNKTALDIEEQRARIAKLKSDTRIVETDSAGGIIFMPTMADRPTPPEDEDDG